MAARTPKGVVHLDVPLEYMLADWTPPQALSTVPPAPTRVACRRMCIGWPSGW